MPQTANPFDRFDGARGPQPVTLGAANPDKAVDSQLKQIQLEKARRELSATPDDADVSPQVLADISSGKKITLDDLPAGARGVVSGLLQGNLPAGQRSIASKTMLPYIKMAMSVDPDFSANTFSARQKATSQLADMKATGGYLTSLAANIDHSIEEEKAINGLNNPGGFLAKWGGAKLHNWWSNEGGPTGAAFDQANRVYSGEQVKSITGNVGTAGGGSALADRQEAQNAISADMPIDSQRAALRIGAIQNYQKWRDANASYRRTMGADIPDSLSREQAAQLLHLMRLQEDGSEGPLPDGVDPGFVALATGKAPSSDAGSPPMPGGPPPIAGNPPGPGGGGQPGPQNPLNYAQGQYGDSTTTTIAGATKDIPNELGIQFMKGLNSLFHAGASDERIRGYASQFGVDPSAQLAYRKANPGFRGSIPPTAGGLSLQVPVTDPASLAANAIARSPTATLYGEAGNAAGAGIPQFLAARFSGNPDLARARFGVARATNPNAAGIGQLAGSGIGSMAGEGFAAKGLSSIPLLYRGLQGADRAAALAPWAARLGDAGFGAATGFTNAPEGQGGKGAALGAALGLGGGMAGRGIVKGVGNVIGGNPSSDIAFLRGNGVRTTLGQNLGDTANKLEGKLTSIPLVGDLIAKSRQRATDDFQKGYLNSALDHIGTSLPGDATPGTASMGYAQKAFGDAYDSARSGMRVVSDKQLNTDLDALEETLSSGNVSEETANRVVKIARNQIGGKLRAGNGVMDGDAYKSTASSIAKIAGQARKSKNFELADALDDLTGVLDGAARRSSPPDAVAAMDAADRGYALFVRAEKAASMKEGDTGTFSPSQLSSSVQNMDNSVRSRAYLRGDALGQDWSDAAKKVLSDKIGRSGPIDRAAAIGLTGAAGYLTPKIAIPLTALTAAYAPGVRDIVSSATARAAGPNAAAIATFLNGPGKYLGTGISSPLLLPYANQ